MLVPHVGQTSSYPQPSLGDSHGPTRYNRHRWSPRVPFAIRLQRAPSLLAPGAGQSLRLDTGQSPRVSIPRLDRGWWRYSSVRDLVRVAAANLVGSVLASLTLVWIVPKGFPRSIYILDFLLCLG